MPAKIVEKTYFSFLRQLRQLGSLLPSSVKKQIKRVCNPVIPEEYLNMGESLISKDRLQEIVQLAEKIVTQGVEGDLIECGVYKGGFTLAAGEMLQRSGSKKILHSIDTFEGHPFSGNEDVTETGVRHHPKGKLSDTSFERLSDLVRQKNLERHIRLYKGLFEQTFPQLENHRFAFALVDCDLYLSTQQCLDFLIPRMNPGGILFFDDYKAWTCPGATQAIEEKFSPEQLIRWPVWQAYWMKH